MLGDESIGEVALAEADTSSTSLTVSAVAEFSWSTLATAVFEWSESVGFPEFSWS